MNLRNLLSWTLPFCSCATYIGKLAEYIFFTNMLLAEGVDKAGPNSVGADVCTSATATGVVIAPLKVTSANGGVVTSAACD